MSEINSQTSLQVKRVNLPLVSCRTIDVVKDIAAISRLKVDTLPAVVHTNRTFGNLVANDWVKQQAYISATFDSRATSLAIVLKMHSQVAMAIKIRVFNSKLNAGRQ